MDADFPIPDFCRGLSVPETRFAKAYAGVPDAQRAWLKTNIARLCEWHGLSRALARSEAVSWRGGFSSALIEVPRDFAVLLLDETADSPAQALAALVPALVSGIPDVLVVRVGPKGSIPDALLAACELAGQELVLEAGPRQTLRLLGHLCGQGRSGVILALGRGAAPGLVGKLAADPGPVRVWRPSLGRAAGVWLDAKHDFDFAALAFALPQTEFTVFGVRPARLGKGFRHRKGSFEEFLAQGFGIVFVPSARAEEALATASLVLCPGQEGCLVWPDLDPTVFLARRIGWDAGPEA